MSYPRLILLQKCRQCLACGLLLLIGAVGCKKKHSGAHQVAPSAPLPVTVAGNPFVGVELFVPDYTNADQARRRVAQQHPVQAALLGKIADTPQARWLGEWSGDVEVAVRNLTRAAQQKNRYRCSWPTTFPIATVASIQPVARRRKQLGPRRTRWPSA